MDEKQIQKLQDEASYPTVEEQRDAVADALLDHINEMQKLIIELNKIR